MKKQTLEEIDKKSKKLIYIFCILALAYFIVRILIN